MTPEARQLWSEYLRETDEVSKEMIYLAYMRALYPVPEQDAA